MMATRTLASAEVIRGKERSSRASKPDPEAEGGRGEAEGRVPPGLPIISKLDWNEFLGTSEGQGQLERKS